MKGKLEIEVGRIWWKTIRSFLYDMKIKYPDFDYIEGPGIISKIFMLYGEKELLEKVASILKEII